MEAGERGDGAGAAITGAADRAAPAKSAIALTGYAPRANLNLYSRAKAAMAVAVDRRRRP